MARRNNTRVRRKVNKNVKVTVYVIISLILLLAIFSVIFSLMNIGNNKTNIGTLIANIDISNMSQEEAKEKIEKWYEEIYTKEISIQYNEMEEVITLEQLGAKIDISEKITEVYKIGKSGNIIKDNYDILFTMLFGRNIELNLEFEEDKLAKTIDELNSKLPNTLVKSNYYIEENNLIIIKGSRGIIIDNEKFENELKNIILSENNKINVPVKEVSPQEINMKQIHEEIYKEVKDAYITENPVNVYPHVNGVDFAISIEEAEEKLLKDDNEIVYH